jgi:hypothetical protein
MAYMVRGTFDNGRAHWLHALYVVLLLAAVALVTLLVGDVYHVLADERSSGEQSHGVAGTIFDLAWLVFVPTFLTSLVCAIFALVVGGALHRLNLTRYGMRALAFCAFSVALVVAVEIARI